MNQLFPKLSLNDNFSYLTMNPRNNSNYVTLTFLMARFLVLSLVSGCRGRLGSGMLKMPSVSSLQFHTNNIIYLDILFLLICLLLSNTFITWRVEKFKKIESLEVLSAVDIRNYSKLFIQFDSDCLTCFQLK